MTSLLFKNSAKEPLMPENVCDDLGLSLLFSESALKILRSVPSTENIMFRAEMFAELLKTPQLCKTLSELEETLTSASKLYISQNRAVCEAVDIYVFAHLFGYISRFAHKASEINASCAAISDFRDEFTHFCSNEKFIEAEKRLPEVKNAIESASEFFIKTDSDGAKLQKENAFDITASLLECAKELNIEITPRTSSNVIWQKGIASAIQKLNPEVFALAGEFYSDFRTIIHGEIFDYIDELRFILEVVEFTQTANAAGIPYSFPSVSENRVLKLKNIYDITLLKKSERLSFRTTQISPRASRFSILRVQTAVVKPRICARQAVLLCCS